MNSDSSRCVAGLFVILLSSAIGCGDPGAAGGALGDGAFIPDSSPSSDFSASPGETSSSSGAQGAASDAETASTAQTLNQSGSRIRARVLRSTDGAQTFVGWYDSQLQRNCQLHYLDGVLRCLPGNPVFGVVFGVFGDSRCTQELAILPRCDDHLTNKLKYYDPQNPPSSTEIEYLVVAKDNNSCNSGGNLNVEGVWQVLGIHEPVRIYEMTSAGCVVRPTVLRVDVVLGRKEDPSRFVEFSEVIE